MQVFNPTMATARYSQVTFLQTLDKEEQIKQNTAWYYLTT